MEEIHFYYCLWYLMDASHQILKCLKMGTYSVLFRICVFYVLFCVSSSSFPPNICEERSRAKVYTQCVSCARNIWEQCPPQSRKLTTGRGVSDCEYRPIGISSIYKWRGCRHACLKTIVSVHCCPGYWGTHCDGNISQIYYTLFHSACLWICLSESN